MRFALPRARLSAPLVACALLACETADPLDEIRRQQSAGHYRASLEPLRALLEQRRSDAEVLFRYGVALALTGQPGLGEWSLREAMQDPDWLVAAGLRLAHDALAAGNYATVVEVVGRVLEARPDAVDALLMRASARAHSRSDFEGALEDVERVLALEPANLEVMEPKILALLGLERYDEAGGAIDAMGQRIEAAELGAEVRGWHCATRAIFAADSGEEELAQERWEGCTQRYPAHANVVSNAVAFYEARGDYARGRALLRTALQESGDDAAAGYAYRAGLAQRLRPAGRPEEAEALLREASAADDPRVAVMARVDLGKHFGALGERAAALAAVEEAVALARELGEPPPDLLLEHADALLLAGAFERALGVASEMKVAPHRTLIEARVAQLRGQPAQALARFDETFRLWPDNPWARYQAARVAEQLGAFERAEGEYRYAIRIAVDATDARTRLARLLLAQGRAAEALRLLRLHVGRHPLEWEGQLLSLRLWAQLDLPVPLRQWLRDFLRGQPGPYLGEVYASIAEGTHAGADARAAVRLLLDAEPLELTDPRQATALAALIQHAAAAGQLAEVEPELRRALARTPDSARLQALLGRWHALGGAGQAAREAFERALELDAAEPDALLGLARLQLDAQPAQALALFERVRGTGPASGEALRGAASALASLGRVGEARERLLRALELEPCDARPPLALAQLELEQGEGAGSALPMAERAVRLGGAAPALELLRRARAGLAGREGAAAAGV